MQTVLFHEIIFGPIHSRRLGISLGVNLLPVSCVHSIACIANAVIMRKEWGRADCLRPIG